MVKNIKNSKPDKTFLFLGLLSLAGLLVYGAAVVKHNNFSAQASSHNNVSGYAWSSNVGWISFNCGNPGEDCGVSDYGVNIHETTGAFSGHAWANPHDGALPPGTDNIGWISFNRADTGDPPFDDPGTPGDNSTPIAELDLASGVARGWGRALAGMDEDDGWDGWISLSGTATPGGEPYSVRLDPFAPDCRFRGWAWGDEVVGWSSFSCVNDGSCGATGNYGVVVDADIGGLQPQAYDLFAEVSVPDAEKVSATSTPNPQCTTNMKFFWQTFSSGCGGIAESHSEIEVSRDAGFTDIVHTNDSVSSGYELLVGSQLDFGTTYYWRVRTIDINGNPSAWAYDRTESLLPAPPGTPFTTPLHPLPNADFSYAPEPPSEGENVGFEDRSVKAQPPGDPVDSRLWTFPSGTPASSTDADVDVVFSPFGSSQITLEVTDGALETAGSLPTQYPQYDGNCTVTMKSGLRIQPPLPEIIEITPVSWLDRVKNLFAFLQ